MGWGGRPGQSRRSLRRLREAVDATGYDGPIEVEIFNQQVWDTPGETVLALAAERFLSVC